MEIHEVDSFVKETEEKILEYEYNMTDEKDLQNGIGYVLGSEWIREYSLSQKDRPDFFHKKNGIAAEVKIKGSAANLIRQIHRYAQYESVNGIMVISPSIRLTNIPGKINKKPIKTVALISSYL